MRLARGFGAVAVALLAGVLAAPPAAALDTASSLRQAICQMVDGAAEANRLPAAFLTRILWQESRFRTDVISPAGAQGVAQFMPQTAAERGLADPYDPGPAIAQAARLLAELGGRFGNLGLAAAAYNAGPRSEEHTSELQSQFHLVCRLLLEKKKKKNTKNSKGIKLKKKKLYLGKLHSDI